MTVEAYPGFLQADTYPAEVVRRMFNSLMLRGSTVGSGIGGLVGATDCKIVTASSGVKVIVEPGELWVPGTYGGSTTQGSYYTRVGPAETMTASGAESNPRVERLYMRVFDAAYSGTLNKAELGFSKGTANASANISTIAAAETYAGAAPENSYTLGYVLVPNTTTLAGQGGVLISGNILNAAPLVALGPPPLRTVATATSLTAKAGEYVQVTATGQTITLPAATANTIVGVHSQAGCTTKVKTAAGTISGDFISAQAEITLEPLRHVLLMADGTNWMIVAGEPKREQTYGGRTTHTKAAMEAGWVPSATRDVYVLFCTALSESEISGQEIDIETGGSLRKEIPPGVTLLVPAGQAVKGTSALTTQVLLR